ncbi:hypothetical protein [Hymenobacter koreensis]|uniref:DUF4397 domain-containing protein n=1 Tax=Hymenobacter koreensis TaxID=1084523 RepID=A0ABP8IVJ8_9BACT
MKILTLSRLRFRAWTVLLAAAGFSLMACEDELEPPYQVVDEGGFATIGSPPAGLQTKYAPGEMVALVVGFNANDRVRDFTVFQVIGRTDSAVVATVPLGTTIFQPAAGLTAQIIPYKVPDNLANKTAVRVDVTTTFENGATRLRRFTYNVAAAPTLRFGTTASPTAITVFRNNLAATAQTEGDIVGYNLVLNEGGIATLPTPPATTTATLFKNVDSLTTFYRIGAGAPVRAGVIRNPSTGAANARTVDVTVPNGSRGQTVTFSFTAYSGPYTATVTAAPVGVVAPTVFSRVRTGRVTAGSNSPQDSASFDLRLGTNVANSAAAATKDVYAYVTTTSTGANAVGLRAENTTVFYRIPAAQAAAGYYNTATANAVGTLMFQNTASLSGNPGVVAPGDVFAVRVRGAEPMLLRVVGTRLSTAGSTARITFEYRAF